MVNQYITAEENLVEAEDKIECAEKQVHEAQTTITERLRSINKDAWGKIENSNGWAYHMNIGHLVHQAADEIKRLEKILQGIDLILAGNRELTEDEIEYGKELESLALEHLKNNIR